MVLAIGRRRREGVFLVNQDTLEVSRVSADGFDGLAHLHLKIPRSIVVVRDELADDIVSACRNCVGGGTRECACGGSGYVASESALLEFAGRRDVRKKANRGRGEAIREMRQMYGKG